MLKTSKSEPLWLRVGELIDGASSQPLKDAHLVYDAHEIRYAGVETPPAGLVREGQAKPDAELPEHTVMPGLTEAHAHLFLEGGELNSVKRPAYLKQEPAALLDNALKRLGRLARLGVIAVRDAGDKDGVGLALSKLYGSANHPLMPYVESPGAAIHRRGRYGSFMGRPVEDSASPAECVAARVRDGADRIKLIATGIINFKKGAVTDPPQFTVAELAELVAAAKGLGRQTFAHASGQPGIEAVIEGGVDSVEHGFFAGDEQLSKMRDRGIAWVPTFAPVQRQLEEAALMGWDAAVCEQLRRILDNHASSLVRAHAMGVCLVAGSDAGSWGVPHGLGFLRELELMENAGLPPLAVVNAATGAGAARLGYKEKFGQLKAGWKARFLLTEHSPLQTVSNLRKPKRVIFDGVELQPAEDDQAGL